MRDLICDVISCCVWSCDTGKINVYDKTVIKNQKMEKKIEVEVMFTYISI